MLNYVINEDTLAIIPYGNKKSVVLENKTRFIVERNPNSIIRNNCVLFGSSLAEKLKKTEMLTGYTYKTPLMLNYRKKLLFFPSSSPRLKDCAWINPLKIKRYRFNNSKSMCEIEFLNGQKVSVAASIRVIENQILRSSRLMSLCSLKPNYLS